jgi:hypothetical protein
MNMKNYVNLTTDEIYDMLPNEISYQNGEPLESVYYFHLSKGLNRNNINYININEQSLGLTRRGEKKLRDPLISMREWLYEFKYQSHQEKFYPDIIKIIN